MTQSYDSELSLSKHQAIDINELKIHKYRWHSEGSTYVSRKVRFIKDHIIISL